ncbi:MULTISPECIES: MucR family transcriptional regulator [Methylobacteriaceae]|uniref:MucR family transcriptional regulator n=1 Tax=Methylobacteriaceae TaxID=119045 RepID=UPI002F35A8A0
MSKPQTKEGTSLLSCTARVVSAYAAGNKLTQHELAQAIALVAEAFAAAEQTTIVPQPPTRLTPEELRNSIYLGDIAARKPRRLTQAEIEVSIQDAYLISFENGLTYHMMRRHLTTMGMTPDEYRAKWGLPEDYPVVAPQFTRRRQHLAKRMSLGNHERPPPPPRKDKRKFRLEGGVWITNNPADAASRDRSADDPERQNPVPLGTGMMVTPEVAALAMAPQQKKPRASRHGGDGNA